MNGYFDEIDEPIIDDKNVLFAFCVGRIRRQNLFCYIVDENEIKMKYALVSTNDFLEVFKLFFDSFDKMEKNVHSPNFQKELQRKLLKTIEFDERQKEMIKDLYQKMRETEIGNANNTIRGLDGFSVHLKINKIDKPFYSWSYADDKEYFYVIDFVNEIMDLLNIEKEYRFIKAPNGLTALWNKK